MATGGYISTDLSSKQSDLHIMNKKATTPSWSINDVSGVLAQPARRPPTNFMMVITKTTTCNRQAPELIEGLGKTNFEDKFLFTQ